MENNSSKQQIVAGQLEGKAILLTRYTSDGPGYAGALLCHIGNGVIQVVMPAIQDMNGNLSLSQAELETPLPNVAEVLHYQDKYAQIIFDNLDEVSREYCESPERVCPDSVAIVRWSNGAIGAIMFWGEPCYVSAFHFEGEYKGQHKFNLESSTEGVFITRRAALEAVLEAPDQIGQATSHVDRKPSCLVHPEYGFIDANDQRVAGN